MARWLTAFSLSLALWGCGPSLYTARVIAASDVLEQAREENAGRYAPYEFHFAESHLNKAREEAAESSYEDAIRYAEIAEDFGKQAVELARERRRELQ